MFFASKHHTLTLDGAPLLRFVTCIPTHNHAEIKRTVGIPRFCKTRDTDQAASVSD